MAYITIPSTDMDVDSPITVALINALENNPTEIAAGTGGAPQIQQAAIASSAIGQSQLNTATGAVSNATIDPVSLTLPGGSYGFYVQVAASSTVSNYKTVSVVGIMKSQTTPATKGTALGSAYSTRIGIGVAGATVYAQQRYIQASPPYDLGDGEVPMFIFAEIDKQTGKVVSAYEAPEAPWHYNGPTNTRADYYLNGVGYQSKKDSKSIDAAMIAAGHPAGLTRESAKALSMLAYQDYHMAFASADTVEVEVTQAVKQSDMDYVPRPMESREDITFYDHEDPIKAAKTTVVMLDPVADLGTIILSMKTHDEFDLLRLLHDGDIIIDNEPLNRCGPAGVPVHGYRWR